jgi:hypothetical protein
LACIFDIILFFGPFLTVLAWRGARSLGGTGLVFWASILTLAAMFASGAFHAAETARACLFIYPFLLLAVTPQFSDQAVSLAHIRTLPLLVFGQSLLMQLFGDYFW